MTEAVIAPINTEQRDAEAALEELDSLAALASESIRAEGNEGAAAEGQSGNDPAQVKSDEDREAERRQRTERAIKMATRQRKLGAAELARVYEGVMVVSRDMQLFDPNIASSAQRFLALTDRTLHMLHRNGHRFLTAGELQKLISRMNEMIGEYVDEAKKAVDSTGQLVQEKKSASIDWIEPKYLKPVFSETVNIKSRPIIGMANALMNWDKAIHNLTELEFNDEAVSSQSNELRRRERHLFSTINRFAIFTAIAMRNRSIPEPRQATNDSVAA